MASITSATSQPPLGTLEPTQPGPMPSNPKGQLGKDQFLQMLVAQMKNQDPLAPMDGQQMAAQLAQFSSVEQLVTLNETMAAQASGQTALLESLGGSLTLGAIGKSVEVDASQAVDKNGNPAPANTVLRGTVDGVRYTTDGPVLTMGEYEFPFGAILSIKS
jgi:flagellar basal-body rod modification protein FlgD